MKQNAEIEREKLRQDGETKREKMRLDQEQFRLTQDRFFYFLFIELTLRFQEKKTKAYVQQSMKTEELKLQRLQQNLEQQRLDFDKEIFEKKIHLYQQTLKVKVENFK